jgi:pyridoxine kinase
MMCAGSSKASDGKSRKFVVNVPIIDGFYSGTGDLFAALTLSILRKESAAMGLVEVQSWLPPDYIPALELPLTRSIERVLGSMHLVIEKTRQARDDMVQKESEGKIMDPKEAHIRNTRRSELRLIQSQQALLAPTVKYTAEELQ